MATLRCFLPYLIIILIILWMRRVYLIANIRRVDVKESDLGTPCHDHFRTEMPAKVVDHLVVGLLTMRCLLAHYVVPPWRC